MSRSWTGSLAVCIALAAPTGGAHAEQFLVQSIEGILGEACPVYDAPFFGLDGKPVAAVTDQGNILGLVICADPQDPAESDSAELLFRASDLDWERWGVTQNGLRQADLTSDAMIEQYDDRVVWRPLLTNPFGFGPQEDWIVEPFDVGGTSYDSPITSRVLPGGVILAQMFHSQGEAILEVSNAGASRIVRYSTPQQVPGGQTASFIAPNWAASEQGVILSSLEDNLFSSLGFFVLDENRLLLGNGTPVAGGSPVANFVPQLLDIGKQRGLFVDASIPQRLLTRDLAGLEDAQVEDTAQAYLSVDIWNPRAALGLPPGDRLAVVSSFDGVSVGARVRFSPFETVIQGGDVLDGKTVQGVEFGTRSMAADVAIVIVYFTDFSRAYYLIAKPPPVSALPGTWGVVLLPTLLVAVARVLGRRRSG